MPAKLYVVHGSHPCDAVAKAMELKDIPFKRVELPPPSHALVMRGMFGARTVPAVRFAEGKKVQGSREIMRELERRAPQPPLYAGPEVEEAERWGDEVLQPIARTMLWATFTRAPRAMDTYQEGGRGPRLPMPVLLAAAPLVTAIERRLNDVGDERVRRELQELPGHLDRIDAWIASGVLGAGETPNAADLQIATGVRLLHTVGDVRPLIAGRPAEAHAFRWFAPLPGSTPAGVFPAEWIPQPAAA
jgi:glutathione S-transferase